MCNEVGHFLEPIACGPRVVPRVGDSGGQNPSRHSPIFPPPPLPSPPVVTAGQARAGDGGGGGIPSLSWIGGGRGTPRCTWERLSIPAATARLLVARRWRRAWCGCGSRRQEVVVIPDGIDLVAAVARSGDPTGTLD